MNEYDHLKIENKWQKVWEKKKPNKAKEDAKRKKFYALIEFPYPSGAGIHVGHVRSNTAMDIISRKRRREGYNVLYPIGWDAFGLPTENYAIKTGIQPAIITKENTDTFRKQLKLIGFSFDWSREIDTTDPKYYKWTQWIFLQLLKEGLAYKKKMTINWCPKDLIGLANEEVINGCCERCGTQVEKKEKEQWMLAITKYAERLDKDLDDTDFLEKIKIQQRNWIGKSEGAEIDFKIESNSDKVKVFTTRPDTIFGVTYIVLAPEHVLVNGLLDSAQNRSEIEKYIKESKIKSEIDRTDAKTIKTGVEIKGVKAINPANNEKVSIWIADYVLADYGTGAVMAVPAHDERDWDFAKRYGLAIHEVVASRDIGKMKNNAYTEEGLLINSGKFNGKDSNSVKREITEFVGGKWVTKFKLRDWIFSRQRYWGEPIPVVHCEKCGIVPLPDKNLPLKLPEVKNYEPTQNGESPLASIEKWVNTKCPKCKGKAKRETDTMPNWAGSSWYYLRYMDSKNNKAFADKKNLEYWGQVDWYNGGMEHTTLHLLYSRFWHKFLFDQGLVPTNEPYKKRTSHGMVLAENGEKMSKSKGNVINPDDIIKTVGADTLRIYEMFMGPFDQAIAWDTNNIAGSRRFLEKVWRLQEYVKDGGVNKNTDSLVHRTIKKVSEDIEDMKFNTAISSMMILVNEFEKEKSIIREHYEILLKLIAPFAPHITEEIWSIFKNKDSIHTSEWPKYDEEKLVSSTVSIMIQINGKVRGMIEAGRDSTEEYIKEEIKKLPEINKWLVDKEIKKVVFIKGKLINIVI
jgi:leucyl-tRNA synthetase